MAFLKKSFLKRRKIDQWVLALASVAMPLRIGLGPLALFLFSCMGVYLSCSRHETARLFAKKFYIFIILYALWSLGLILFRGEPLIGNRQISYTLMIVVFAFAGPGMLLIRDPLRYYVLGSRIGIIGAAFLSLYLAWATGERIGVGGNQAVFAFVAAIAAISAMISINNAPSYLPNGPHWLILGFAAVLVSETRAILIVLPVFIIIEAVLYLRRYHIKLQAILYAALAAVLAVLIVAGPVGAIMEKRFAGMIEYYNSGDSSEWTDKVSADIREVMWANTIKVVKQNPVIGVGSYAKMDIVRAQAGEQGAMLDGYRHVHNTVLDELLNDGVVGLILMLAAFLSIFVYLWKTAGDWGVRRAIVYFAVISASYGMLHNPLLHEATIASTMFFLAALNAEASRRIMAARRAGLSNFP